MVPWCPDEACGQRQAGSGHPRRGWVQVKVSGEGTAPLWFCGALHAAVALLDEAALTPTTVDDMPRALRLLNQLAGTYLTIQTATPARIRRCLDQACSRIVTEVTEEARRQERRRPTLTQLSEELESGTITDHEHDETGATDDEHQDRMDRRDVEPAAGM